MLYAVKPPSPSITNVRREGGRMILESELFLTVLEPKASGIVRVTVTREKELSDMPRPGIVSTPAYMDWTYEETSDEIVLTTGGTVLRILRETASFSWYDERGRLLLAEAEKDSKVLEKFPKYRMAAGRTERVKTSDGEKEIIREAERVEDGFSYHAALNIRFQDGEAIYGFGQHEEGYGNLRGKTLYLYQENRKIVVPMMVSSLGYGILMDTYSPLIFSDGGYCQYAGAAAGRGKDALQQNTGYDVAGISAFFSDGETSAFPAYIYSEAVPELDFYFINGGTMEGVVRGYRYLTGGAAMLPKWAFGYIQSQERYETQEEIGRVAAEYRRRGIGLDCVVLDWCSWEDGKWGQKTFDAKRFPDPAGMVERLHGQHTHFMISVWANSDPGCENHEEFRAAGLFLPGQNIYNALSAAGREMYWKQMNEGLFRYGIDAWWCDNSEPITPEWNHVERPAPSRAYDEYVRTAADHLPAEQTNAFALYHAQGVYEGQRKTTGLKRVCNLTRSAYTGSQRYGTILWSGDVAATWDTLTRQIAAGLNFCASGLPYWTTDIGAFFVKRGLNWYWRGDFEDTVNDYGYRELFTRWYQWGAFLPVFRGHGTDCRRELWLYENTEDVDFYDAILKANRTRYRLMPYIYSAAGNCRLNGGLMMEPLAFGWSDDTTALEVKDQYMFGPSLMVCPVHEPMYYLPRSRRIAKERSRRVYLPETPGGWYDYETGERLEGGRWISAPAPIDRIPVFVKAGSVIPEADFALSTEEQSREIRVKLYPGADGEFCLYEDDGDGYGYENGEYRLTMLRRDDGSGELSAEIVHDYEGGKRGYIMKEQILAGCEMVSLCERYETHHLRGDHSYGRKSYSDKAGYDDVL